MLDTSKIYYLPNQFCINFDKGVIPKDLIDLGKESLTIEQAAFLHEYYHYINNLTTFEGLREFLIKFVDRVIIVTNLLYAEGLKAFPIEHNTYASCRYLCRYWASIDKTTSIDLVNKKLSIEVSNSPSKRFNISGLERSKMYLSCLDNNGNRINGFRYYYKVETHDLVYTSKFSLSIGAIDEFLSASIDEFCFQYDLSNNIKLISSRPYYPYQFYDEILDFFGIDFFTPKDKILVAYTALRATNPVSNFVRILRYIKRYTERYKADPSSTLLRIKDKKYQTSLKSILIQLNDRYKEALNNNKIYYASSIYSIIQEANIANQKIQNDFFFFIRPFMVDIESNINWNADFIKSYKQILETIRPPVIRQEGILCDLESKNLYNNDIRYAELLNNIVIMTDITNSLYKYQFAKNINRVQYINHTLGNDEINKMMPRSSDSWQIGLNQFGLLGLYVQLKNKPLP